MENNHLDTPKSIEHDESQSNIKQQNELIDYFATGDPGVFGVAGIEKTPEERQSFLENVRNHSIDDSKFSEALLNISCPISHMGPDGEEIIDSVNVYQEIALDINIKRIIAKFTGFISMDSEKIGPVELESFYNQFPEPLSLDSDPRLSRLMKTIKALDRTRNKEMVADFQSALSELNDKLYGKRYEYFKQIKILKAEAWRGYFEYDLKSIEQQESDEIMSKLVLTGTIYPYLQKKLTVGDLVDEDLTPAYKLKTNDSVEYFFSKGYKVVEGRMAVMAYIEDEDEPGAFIASSYYCSNSQGIWRYLPEYGVGDDGMVNWFGKGKGEESITLPSEVQKALSEIAIESSPTANVKGDLFFVFAGTVSPVDEKRTTYHKDVGESQYNLSDKKNIGRKLPPEQVDLPLEKQPDFEDMLTSWKQSTNLYGDVDYEVFDSRDGTMRFIFCRDSSGRAWVSNIEDNKSDVQSNGLNRYWVNGGDLTTPIYEYPSQASGYGNGELVYDHYVDMFTNYISRIPIVQEYLRVSAERTAA